MKQTIRDNYRVTVEMDTRYSSGSHEALVSMGEQIVQEVNHHVDNVEVAYVAWDTKTVCSHCGEEWIEDEYGAPECCNPALQEWAKDMQRLTQAFLDENKERDDLFVFEAGDSPANLCVLGYEEGTWYVTDLDIRGNSVKLNLTELDNWVLWPQPEKDRSC